MDIELIVVKLSEAKNALFLFRDIGLLSVVSHGLTFSRLASDF